MPAKRAWVGAVMLVPTLLLAGVALVSQTEDPQEAPAAGSSAELALELVARGDFVSAEQLEVLAGYGDRDALEGLVEILEGLTRRVKIRDACLAFVGFAGTPLEPDAVALLAEMALGWPMDPATRPSAQALASLGTRASDALLRVARESVDHGARAIAVGALAPVLIARSRDEALRAADFALVLDAYHPPLSGTQAFGAELLAALARGGHSEALRDALWGKDDGVVRRSLAAAALVELGDAESLQTATRALRASDPEVALAVIHALGRRGVAVDPDRLRRLSRAGDPRLAYAATLAHCRVLAAEVTLRELPQLARSNQPERRAAVASFLGSRTDLDPKLEALYLVLVEDEDLAVRIAALPGLAERRRPETIELLVRRMWSEGERMRARIREVLVELTASDHGPRPARWGAFWDDRHEGFELPSKRESDEYLARRSEAQGRGSTRAFFGLDLASDRVAFVFDISGSMDTRHPTGTSRLDAVKSELDRVLQSFPRDGRFNLIAFDDRARPMRRRSMESGEKELRRALKWLRGRRAKGGTDVQPAVRLALEDREIDTICVLTDGQIGTAGNDAFLAEVERGAALREVRILGVSFGGASAALRELADRTGGDYVER